MWSILWDALSAKKQSSRIQRPWLPREIAEISWRRRLIAERLLRNVITVTVKSKKHKKLRSSHWNISWWIYELFSSLYFSLVVFASQYGTLCSRDIVCCAASNATFFTLMDRHGFSNISSLSHVLSLWLWRWVVRIWWHDTRFRQRISEASKLRKS